MTKTLSVWRINEMKNVFEQLNKVPIEIRREWGMPFKNYSFAVDICNALLEKMERENKRVKKATEHKFHSNGERKQ